MDGYLGALYVLQDALVGGGLAALVVLGLKAVDGDDYVEFLESSPFNGNDSEGAGDDLGVDASSFNLREEELEFAVADQGVAADEGHVQGLLFVEES